MKYEYEFDFGANPAFVYDAWFRKTFLPMALLLVVFFPLTYFIGGTLGYIFASLAVGMMVLFLGIYIHRRTIAKRRVKGVDDTVFHYEINENGIAFENEIGEGIIKWGFKGKIVNAGEFYIIQSNEVGLLPLPQEIPDDKLAFVKEKIQSAAIMVR